MTKVQIRIKNLSFRVLKVAIDKDNNGEGYDSYYDVPYDNDLNKTGESTWTRNSNQKLKLWIKDPNTDDYTVKHFETKEITIIIDHNMNLHIPHSNVNIEGEGSLIAKWGFNDYSQIDVWTCPMCQGNRGYYDGRHNWHVCGGCGGAGVKYNNNY